MAGIVAYSAYIPLHRISRAEFNRAWGGFAIPGEIAVAGYDEDSITMAMEAATDCLRGIDTGSIMPLDDNRKSAEVIPIKWPFPRLGLCIVLLLSLSNLCCGTLEDS